MNRYISHFEHMTYEQKEAIFQGHLKSLLTMKDFILAIPEPNIGEDIWVTRNQPDSQIYPAQVKSAFMWQQIKDGRAKRYVVNIKAHRFESTLHRKFFYFFGFYDPGFRSGSFHVGCIPSSFFLEHWDFLTKKKLITIKDYQSPHKERINLAFDYYVDENEYFVFVKPLVNVTNFFKDFSVIS